MATDFLTAKERTLISNDVTDLLADPQITTSITYKTLTSRGGFSVSGTITETFSSKTIASFKVPFSQRERELEGARYQVGDERYLIRVSDIAAPKKDDRVLEGTKEMYLFESVKDPLGLFHSIVVRNLRA